MEKKTYEVAAGKEFNICFGEFTQEEKEHLLKIGHILENSDGKIVDVST